MNKREIFDVLNEYAFDKKEFVIISGSAMVIYGIKEKTSDIDISVSYDLYNKILVKYKCIFEKNVNGYNVWFVDNIINFSENYYNNINYENVNGYNVQTVDSIIELKKSLGREKDKEDLKKILRWKHINNEK